MTSFLTACGLLCIELTASAQTADRSAAPPSAATAAPASHSGTYAVQNGQLLVAPGLRIPNGNVPWALDIVNGKQVLVPVHHSALKSLADTVDSLEGDGSRTPLRTATPVFFVHTSDRTENAGDAGRGSPTGWALLPVLTADGMRTVNRVRFADLSAGTVCTGSTPCLRAESLPEGWLRMTPQQPLDAGQYVLMPVQRTTPALAYDFSVSPQSPAARDMVSPGQNLDAAPGGKQRR